MADKEFTQICKEILGIGKRLEIIEPEELRKIKADIEKISELVAANKTLFDTDKKDFDGKYNKIVDIIKTFDTLKAQIEEVLKSGTINDSAEALISTFSSKKIMDLLNEVKRVIDEKFSTIYKNGITPWNSTLEYPADAISVFDGKLYQAKSENINKNPSENKEIWHVIASEEWCEKTFLNKNEKIDSYSKTESDDKFALKMELTDGLPIGAYLSYPSQKTIPAGFMIADGRSLKKAEYTELFDIIGYTYGGSGDNFSLPNFSDGKFMRSIGGNAAALGVIQQDAFQGHYHRWSDNPSTLGWAYNLQGNTSNRPGNRDTNQSPIVQPMSDGVNGEPRTANETRPYNMAVVVIIKAKNVNTPTAGQIDKTILATETKAGITKLKNSITAKQEDAAVTEKAVNDAIEANKSIGVGQTWQDVLTQRKGEVLYTNTTGRPIMVSITADSSSPALNRVALYVGDVRVARFENVNGLATQLCAIVPDKKTYQLKSEINASIVGIMDWVELR